MGIPSELLAFHSLRSGFLCGAIMKGGTNPGSVAQVLSHTAYVAGWQPGRGPQLQYVRDTVKRTIVGNRLITGGTGINNTEIEPELTTSEGFHNISLGETNFPD